MAKIYQSCIVKISHFGIFNNGKNKKRQGENTYERNMCNTQTISTISQYTNGNDHGLERHDFAGSSRLLKAKGCHLSVKAAEFQITSGKGLFYSLGWKKTTVTVKNTGRYSVAMYERNKAGLLFYKGQVGPGRTVTMTMRGSSSTSRLLFQRVGGRTTVSVSVNAGSVS